VKSRIRGQLKGSEIIGKKILFLGDAGSGKTGLAAQILQELMKLVDPNQITIIDLAPKRIGKIGGKMTDYLDMSSVRYVSPENVHTPRLAGTSRQQVLYYAELNRRVIKPLLKCFIQNATEVLVLNDVTLYLHLGKLENVLECVRLAKTFLGTAYYGSIFDDDLGTGISSRERQLTDRLATFMDSIVRVD
jgi:hypothetical protein